MSTALYRRYRPETFADVIGQEHVTAPLMQALRSDRVNHAYLFSGPRGCGKTTSARILARILNCAAWEPDASGRRPDAPCGECDSCVELSRGGSGSLDVVEIDAASHGGVDDARELRERATFAPARDRFKVFVIDEAHMVSSAGFNALLKIVEEPPPHVRFIFATTEPDKVLQTIRSRTHHYPFHLVPSERLLSYLDELCIREQVPVGKGVLPLVVRAGGGSVRDSLSVLDQLMAGAGPDGVDYELAVSLLGYTHASLLDDVVDALAAGDGASVFRVVDRVIESGHDPRRFVEDLLERYRDLIVVRAVGEGAQSVLRGLPEDQLARMTGQAGRQGAGELSRAADVCNAALTEMTGATSPRLHLELLVARLLLPAAETAERGLVARLDRLERRVGVPGAAHVPVVGTLTVPGGAAAPAAPAAPDAVAAPAQRTPGQAPAPGPRPPAVPDDAHDRPVAHGPGEPPAAQPAAAAPAPTPTGAEDELDTVRRSWEDVLGALAQLKRGTWTLVSQNAHVAGYADGVLRLGFSTEGLAKAFGSGAHADFVRQALIGAIGLDAKVVAVAAHPDAAAPAATGAAAGAPAADRPPADNGWGAPPPAGPEVRAGGEPPTQPPPGQWSQGTQAGPSQGQQNRGEQTRGEQARGEQARGEQTRGEQPRGEQPTAGRDAGGPTTSDQGPASAGDVPAARTARAVRDPGVAGRGADAARAAARRPGGTSSPDDDQPRSAHVSPEHDTARFDDPDAEDSGLVGPQVVEQILGGKVIEVEG